jgi:hypothetical protein
MKYIRLFEAWDDRPESEWDREIREKREAKTSELMGYSINGQKVIATEAFEDCGLGFMLENKNVILVECYKSNRISLFTEDDYEYPDVYQNAVSDYDYNYDYKKWKNGDFKPIFNTKADAQTFLYLFKKEYGELESCKNIKIKLKYIFTPDIKEITPKELKQEDFNKFIGNKFILPKYGTFGNEEEYYIEKCEYEEKYGNKNISFDLIKDVDNKI